MTDILVVRPFLRGTALRDWAVSLAFFIIEIASIRGDSYEQKQAEKKDGIGEPAADTAPVQRDDTAGSRRTASPGSLKLRLL